MTNRTLTIALSIFLLLMFMVLVTGCLNTMGMWGRAEGAPLPFPKEGYWGKNPSGDYALYQSGRRQMVFRLFKDGYADVMLDNELALPFTPHFKWERTRYNNVIITDTSGMYKFRISPPNCKSDTYRIERIRTRGQHE